MKLTGGRAEAFLRKPDPAVAAVLLFGPDGGLVRERAEAVIRAAGIDAADPFRSVDLDGAALKADPARLGDEARAISLGGGRRLVRVRGAGDEAAAAVAAFLDSADAAAALVVVEAADLGKRSALRKLFEDSRAAAAIGCYGDDARSLSAVIVETLAAHGLKATPDALAFLAANLGADRVVTRSELEKLALYMGEPGAVTLDDAVACVGDSAGLSLDDIVFAAAGGDARALERALARAFAEGIAPVAVLRAAARHFQRLHWVLGQVRAGRTVEQAVKGLRPPLVFFNVAPFKAQVGRWTPVRLGRVLDLLVEAELDCKTTGMPDVAVCGRALLRVAQAARVAGG